MVVDICTVSVVSAIRIRKKICGPCPEDGPNELESIGVVPNSALVPGPDTDGTVSPPPPVAVVLSSFLAEAMVREGRRWILLSSRVFCCTWVEEASKTAYAPKLNFEILAVRSGAAKITGQQERCPVR